MGKTFYWIFGLGLTPFVALGVLGMGYALSRGEVADVLAVGVVLLLFLGLAAALLGGIAWAMRNGRRGRLSPEERERLREKYRARSAASTPRRPAFPWLFTACTLVVVALVTAWVLQGGFRVEALLFAPCLVVTLIVVYIASRDRGWESRPRSRGLVKGKEFDPASYDLK